MNRIIGARKLAWAAYALIVFEILYMISPFALFYYSAYGLPLDLLRNSTATSWLTRFILPHYSYSGSILIRLHDAAGWVLILTGLTLFAVGFYQVYSAKIFRKGEVTGGLYRHIRHPQYASLAVLGFGTFLVWPRFIILIAFVSMLFLYFFLARAEEQECLARFGVEYAKYRERTGMFFPRMRRVSAPAMPSGYLLPATGAARIITIILLYVLLVSATILIGHAVRQYALSTLVSFSDGTSYVLSLVDLDAKEVRDLYETVTGSDVVKPKIPAGGKRLLYLLPEAWQLPELPVGSSQDHVTPDVYDESAFKILIASPIGPVAAAGNDILGNATGLEPHALVFIDRRSRTIRQVIDPPRARWAGIAVPLF